MSENGSGTLEVGTNDAHEVVVNLPRDMTGHIVFSTAQARALAETLTKKAREADTAQREAAEAARVANIPPADRTKLCTTNGESVAAVRASQTNETGQHAGYIVLCDAERAKGFVRPYRDAYKHVGRAVCGKAVADPALHEPRLGGPRRVCMMSPDHDGPCGEGTVRVLTQHEQVDVERRHRIDGCNSVTTMGRALSETYARDPKFYGATFCCHCNRHLPVAEFVWTADGQEVGS